MKISSFRAIPILLGAAAVSWVEGFSTTSKTIYQSLSEAPLVRASDSSAVPLTSLWKEDEYAVCAFLRHFGCFTCWENAAAIKERVLSEVPGKKVLFVGVGTGQAAAEFAKQLEIDPSLCFGDEGGQVGDILGFEKGLHSMMNPSPENMVQNMVGRHDLGKVNQPFMAAVANIGIQALTPKKVEDTMRQGGTFVFKGDKLLLEHFDSTLGDNCEIDAILAALKK